MNKIESIIAFFTDADDYIETISIKDLVKILKEVDTLPKNIDHETLS